MRSISRKRNVVFLICGILLVAVFVAVASCLFTVRKETVDKSRGNGLSLEMQVGEVYDLEQYFGRLGGLFEVYESRSFATDLEEKVFVDGKGGLHVLQPGIYDFAVRVTYETALFEETREDLVQVKLVAHDYEFDDYTPVDSYDDLKNSSGGKYILAKDIDVSRRSMEDVQDFSGFLVNPEGYTITLKDDYPLFEYIGKNSIVRGLEVRSDGNGIFCPDPDADPQVISWGGVIAMGLGGVLCDSTVEADLYGHPYDGMVGDNGGKIWRCTFRGTMYGLGEFGNKNTFAISGNGGELRDCTVFADGYRGQEKDPVQRVSVFGVSPTEGQTGNRVFDLSGEHEIDFGSVVTHSTRFRVQETYQTQTFELYAGCVAEFPANAAELLAEEEAVVTGTSDGDGNSYGAGETWFLPHGEKETFLFAEAKYLRTQIEFSSEDESKISKIIPAESIVELPEGKSLQYLTQFGLFSPDFVTLRLAADTQTEYDTMFPKGLRELGSPIHVAIDVDFAASEVYEQRADGVYRIDNGKLCRYEGEVRDGVVTLPDGVTSMSGDPFGDLDFYTLHTNDLKMFSYITVAKWVKDLKKIRLDSGLNVQSSSFASFSSLEYIETENRTDNYFAEDGILYEGEGIVSFVPCSYAAGATLTLSDAEVLNGALTYNRAKTIVFVNAKVRGYALKSAKCSEVIVRGSGTSFSENAFYNCHSLISFRAEGIVTSLASSTFYGCSALEGIELNHNYQSVAYNAVEKCTKFAGYTQEEGCEKFTLADGILFVDGAALVYSRWIDEHEVLTIPEGMPEVTLHADSYGLRQDSRFTTLRLSADVQSFSALRFPAKYYEVDKGNEYFSAQDGVLFSADGTRLIAYPTEKDEKQYTVPDSVTEIGEYAFAYAEKLDRVILGENTQTIGEYAFQNADLINVIYNSALKTIGRYAFFDANLAYVNLPDSLETLEEYAFYAASVSTQIRLPAGIGEIKKSVFENASIKSIDIPEGITSVGEDAFAFSSLKEISLPQSLLSVGENAFRDTLLERVALGKNVQEVGAQAFYNCTSLAEVTAENSSTEYGDDCFKNTKFLKEGKTAEDGAIYLGNTLFSLFGEGESAEVRYGTTRIFSLESVKVKTLKLPATLSEIPSVDGLPYLEELWLGVAPQGADQTNVDLGSVRFRAKADHLYIRFPKYVTFSGELGEDVYFCYDGTQAEFEQFARLENAETYADRIYYRDVGSQINVWDVDEQGNIQLHAADAAFSAGEGSLATLLSPQTFAAVPAQNLRKTLPYTVRERIWIE